MRSFVTIILVYYFGFLQAQEELIICDDRIPGNDTVWVFKPSNYNLAEKYPAVYLLHGINGNYSSWNRLVNLQEYSDQYRFIIICPDGFNDSFYFNSPLLKNSEYESYFTGKLYPEILERFSIDSTRIFITGLSMGGAGAMYLFLRNQQLFLSAGSTSGVLDLACSRSRESLEKLLGSYYTGQKKVQDYSAITYLENIKNSGKQIIFDCGTADHVYTCNNMFRKKCDELKIRATYISQPGRHESKYWKMSVRYHFEFFNSLIKQ